MLKFKQVYQIVKNMGWRYVGFRVLFELKKRSGLFKKKFPVQPDQKTFISLDQWKRTSAFFGVSKSQDTPFSSTSSLDFESLKNGRFTFFGSKPVDLGIDYDWVTNPDTDYKYDINTHWLEIQDFDANSGDIKYVWEKSRFSFLYDVMRHETLTGADHAEWVFNQIDSWMKANPVNCGPNYKCSQEISLRVLNWTYALHYYKDSEHLTEAFFQRTMHAIYWQMQHVYDNINFSRIAVRNNHAITETLALYIIGGLYSFFPSAAVWRSNGKKWFELEIDYQIYSDGTFLQFSMNYHRVVIQLFTWAIVSSEHFNDRFSEHIYEKAYRSLYFLYACQDDKSGWLPNYGNNDGALFFKFNNCDFRDYRPQLNVLHLLLTGKKLYGEGQWEEDTFWFNSGDVKVLEYPPLSRKNGWENFEDGGYYVLRDGRTLTFLRCGKHKDRPAQADNLHLDIWHEGINLAYDSGTYKYNTESKYLRYFMGTHSHNTVMLSGNDQMLKGPRFIWYNWSQAMLAKTSDNEDAFTFIGTIEAFKHIKNGIRHTRKVEKEKGRLVWNIVDEVTGADGMQMKQVWHVLPSVSLISSDSHSELIPEFSNGWKSEYYGFKEEIEQVEFTSKKNIIKTRIIINENTTVAPILS